MLMMSFDDALTRANFRFVYFLKVYLLDFFDIFQWEGFEPLNPPPLWLRHCNEVVRTYTPVIDLRASDMTTYSLSWLFSLSFLSVGNAAVISEL